jgi:hypothetical protein
MQALCLGGSVASFSPDVDAPAYSTIPLSGAVVVAANPGAASSTGADVVDGATLSAGAESVSGLISGSETTGLDPDPIAIAFTFGAK